jgi:hypothetical protein
MRQRVSDPHTSSEVARYEAQKLAFAPLMFQAVRAMRDLGVLDSLYRAGDKGALVQDVVQQTGVSTYAAGLMLEAGYATGLCSYEEPRFTITKTGVFWLQDELTRVNADFNHHACYRGAFHFEEAMRTGLPAGLRELGPWSTVYEGLSQLPPDIRKAWFAFNHFYSDNAFEQCLPHVLLERVRHVVDIGGNTGRFASLCLLASPDLKITLVDLPAQLALANEALAHVPDRSRVDLWPANLLMDDATLPQGADVYWMSQFLDCFSEAEISSILRRVALAMGSHSRAFVLETFWDRQRYDAARFCVIGTSLYFACIANGNSRMYHSRDMMRLASDAGLHVESEDHSIDVAHSLLTLRTKS